MPLTEKVGAIHKMGTVKMTFTQRQGIEQEVRELKEELRQIEDNDRITQTRPDLLQSVPSIKQRIKVLEETLNKDDDLIPKGGEKDVLVRRRKDLEAEIKKHMPTVRDWGQSPRNQLDFNKAVDKTVHYTKKCQPLIQEWQEIMRRLEPDNPDADDVSQLQ